MHIKELRKIQQQIAEAACAVSHYYFFTEEEEKFRLMAVDLWEVWQRLDKEIEEREENGGTNQ